MAWIAPALALLLAPPPPPPERPTLEREAAAPFSWFLVPSDVVGFKDSPEGFQLTYDCSWNNGFAEFCVLVGPRRRQAAQRVRVLADDLPEIQWTTDEGGVRYRLRTFGIANGLDPRRLLSAIVRVEAANFSREPRAAAIQGLLRPVQGPGRADLPCEPWYRRRFADLERVPFREDGPAASGHLLLAVRNPGAGWVELEEGQPPAWSGVLQPGATAVAEFKIPYVPLAKSRAEEVESFRSLGYDEARGQAAKVWKGVFDRAMELRVPESKVVRTYRASLGYLLIARDAQEAPDRYVQKVNEFQYDHFYARDTAFIARAYEMVGLHDVARQVLESYLVRDRAGKVVAFARTAPDDWGQSVWAVASWVRATGDDSLAREAYPALAAHLRHLREETSKDPLGLWPVAGPYDNEVINGHYTAHSFWVLLGLRESAYLARMAGHPEAAPTFLKEHDAYRQRFLSRLRWIVSQTGGYIPPGVDKPLDGHDWENASGGVYPFGVFPPDHPLVRATIDLVRETKYREGIMTWGPNAFNLKTQILAGVEDPDPLYLHHYETFHVMQTQLARGEQRDVIEDLYSVLAHTSATHAGFETTIRPWGDRDPGGNRPPHGWFAGRTIELLRNLFAREEGHSLHLLSALSPAWVKPGETIGVRRCSTDFGSLDLWLRCREGGATLTLHPTWRRKPERLVLHWPWFVRPIAAVADGRPVPIRAGVTELRPDVSTVRLDWRALPTDRLSYDEAVRIWLRKNYRSRPGEDRMFLFPQPVAPRLLGAGRMFVGAASVRWANPSGKGEVRFTTDGAEPTVRSPKAQGPIRIDRTTTLKAAVFWPDGRRSPTTSVRLERVVPKAPDCGQVAGRGLRASLYVGSFDRLPGFDKLRPVTTATVAAPTLDLPGRPEDGFSLRFEGAFWADRDGVYAFALGSDDGSRLEIGGRVVVDNDGLHAYRELRGDIALKRGWHRFAVSVFDAGSVEYLRLFLLGPDGSKTPVPAERFGLPPVRQGAGEIQSPR